MQDPIFPAMSRQPIASPNRQRAHSSISLRAMSRLVVVALVAAVAGSAQAQNPSPFINETQPVSGRLYGPSIALTVKGAGFGAAAQVNWIEGATNTPLTTLVISSTQVVALVPASLLTQKNTASITVVNPDAPPYAGTSNIIYFPVTIDAPFVFTQSSTKASIGGPVTADLNGDGIADFAALDGGTQTVNIFLGVGNGTFQDPLSFPVSSYVSPITMGDFNGDGTPDLAVAQTIPAYTGPIANTISLVLSDGRGGFTPSSFTVPCAYATLTTGDFNKDGKVDLEMQCDSGGYFIAGNGDGTFVAPVSISNRAFDDTQVTGDFNGDGNLDVVILEQLSGCGSPSPTPCYDYIVEWGHGNGTFQQSAPVAVPGLWNDNQPAITMATGDFNNDGLLDFALTAPGSPTLLTTYLYAGSNTFTAVNTTAPGMATSIQAGDFNDDGNLDLAVSSIPNVFQILYGHGDGTFYVSGDIATTGSSGIAVADFNGDGRLDVVGAWQGYTILLQDPLYYLVPLDPWRFKPLPPGGIGLHTFVLEHLSPGPLRVTRVEVSKPGNAVDDFLALNFCIFPIPSGGRCEVPLLFFARPGVTDPNATLSIYYDGPGSPLKVPISGQVGLSTDTTQ